MSKKKIVFVLKLLLSLSIITYVFLKIDLKSVGSNLIRLDVLTVFLVIATTIIKFITQYYNWKTYLAMNPNYQHKKFSALITHFIGLALRFTIPGGHGTFGKALFLKNKKAETTYSVFIEKFYTSWFNFLLASVSCFFFFKELSILLKISAIVLVLISPLLVFWGSKLFFKNVFNSFSGNFFKVLPKVAVSNTLYTSLTLFQYFIIVNHLQSINSGIPISFFTVLITIPLILSANSIPITFSGLGLRETFSIVTLTKFGVTPEIAVSTSLIIFFFNAVLPAVPGLYLIFTYKKQ